MSAPRGDGPTADGAVERCPWAGISDTLYTQYHDEEWGVPHADDRRLFEKLILEGFQAGLSWLTILRKRPAFRDAFDGFDPAAIARYSERDVARLMADAQIVRNRAKIEATISNARAYLKMRNTRPLGAFVWDVVDGRPMINRWCSIAEVPSETAQSRQLSKAFKANGFRFVGPTTVYAFMQSVGIVNDHLVSCHRHAPCAELQASFQVPLAGRATS